MSGPETTIQQLRKLIVDNVAFRLPVAKIHAQTPLFAGGLELTSFAVVELIGHVERHFQFQFREADFREEYFLNLQTLAELIERSLPPVGSSLPKALPPEQS